MNPQSMPYPRSFVRNPTHFGLYKCSNKYLKSVVSDALSCDRNSSVSQLIVFAITFSRTDFAQAVINKQPYAWIAFLKLSDCQIFKCLVRISNIFVLMYRTDWVIINELISYLKNWLNKQLLQPHNQINYICISWHSCDLTHLQYATCQVLQIYSEWIDKMKRDLYMYFHSL